MNIFGNLNCESCDLETRFLLELEEEASDLYMLGDEVHTKNNPLKGKVECDYCQKENDIFVVLNENIISAFLNKKEYMDIITNGKKVEKASENQGLKQELKKNLKQFHDSFYVSFKMQPYQEKQKLKVKNTIWTVRKSLKKESVEKDIVKRVTNPSYDQYCYEIEDNEGTKKWLVVTDIEGYEELTNQETEENVAKQLLDVEIEESFYKFKRQKINDEDDLCATNHNAIIMPEPPYLKDNEILHDVTDSLFKTSHLFREDLTDNLFMEAYEYISGVRVYVYNKEGELELDIFEETTEKAIEMIEAELTKID